MNKGGEKVGQREEGGGGGWLYGCRVGMTDVSKVAGGTGGTREQAICGEGELHFLLNLLPLK